MCRRYKRICEQVVLDIALSRIFKLVQCILARKAKRLVIEDFTGMRRLHPLHVVVDAGLVVLRHDKVLDGLSLELCLPNGGQVLVL